MNTHDQRRDAVRLAIPPLDELRAEALERGRASRRYGVWYATDYLLRATKTRARILLLGAFARSLLVLLVLATGMAALVPGLVDSVGEEIPYAVFVAPALLVAATMSVATLEFSAAVRRGFTGRRVYGTLVSTPIVPAQVFDAIALAGLLRMLIVSIGFYVVMVVFRLVPSPNTGWISVPIALLGAIAYGMPLLAWTARLHAKPTWFSVVREMQFAALFLLSGTFYPLGLLPGWIGWIGWFSPLWHASELGRIATYGTSADPAGIIGHTVFLLGFAAVGTVLARAAFVRRMGE